MSAPLVSLRGVTRRFGPVLANDAVSLDLMDGEIHAIIGENGAGKSTLMKVLYGMHPADAGTITVAGREVRITRPTEAMRLGLGMVHQHFMLVDTLTVAENVVLGREPHGPLGAFAPRRSERLVRELAERFRLPVDPHARVSTLSVGEQQRVEILKALHHGARVLILDEPTAGLDPVSSEILKEKIRRTRDEGKLVLITSHILSELEDIVTEIVFMQDGKLVFHKSRTQLQEDTGEEKLGRALARVMNAKQAK